MGSIRSSNVKNIAIELYGKYKDEFSKDFEQNKKSVNKYTDVSTKKLRNQIAGYITKYYVSNSSKEQL